jgi:hypothetical protein
VYGATFDEIVEYSRLPESTNRECLLEFARTVRKVFEEEWLRLPSEAECMQISSEFEALGFPGCIGSVDCAS